MSTAPHPRPATCDDVLGAPEHVAAELVDGALLPSPRPAARHAHAAAAIGIDLGGTLGRWSSDLCHGGSAMVWLVDGAPGRPNCSPS